MNIKGKLYLKFKEFFENELYQDKVNQIMVNNKNKFNTFIESFDNKYIDNNIKDINFRKKFIKKYANYLFLDGINHTMSENNAIADICTFDFDKIFNLTKKKLSLSTDTVYITHPWSGANLTGNTNAYRGVVQNGFVFDQPNVQGLYIDELDIAYIYNGNHSISIGSIVDDINVETSDEFLKSCNLKKEFYSSEILFDRVIINSEEIEIKNWKFAALLKMIQYTYKESK